MANEMMYQRRAVSDTKFEIREADNDQKYIEGYFVVFGSEYHLWDGATETVDRGAFDGTLGDDIRALANHDTRLVLGRTSAGTLSLRVDDYGLWGRIAINPKDSDAVNLYERVARGDVSQCSFGFDILDEETEYLPNGDVKWTIKSVKLYEVSVVTFPAYEETGVYARQHDLAAEEQRRSEMWRNKMHKKLKGELC